MRHRVVNPIKPITNGPSFVVKVLLDDCKKDRYMVGIVLGDKLEYVPVRDVSKKTACEMLGPIQYAFEFGISAMHDVVRFMDCPDVTRQD
jgi:hypothetical protein